ncbi:hypothetical protein GCM10008942_16230 [Rhizomicrobium electricum]|uniref:Uncharacterized protein n=1 Tax=Rhizomicrobium electricum TaxID=480070 RepID=A0ABN1EK87_9PROT
MPATMPQKTRCVWPFSDSKAKPVDGGRGAGLALPYAQGFGNAKAAAPATVPARRFPQATEAKALGRRKTDEDPVARRPALRRRPVSDRGVSGAAGETVATTEVESSRVCTQNPLRGSMRVSRVPTLGSNQENANA